METRGVASAISYVPLQVEAGAAAGAAGTQAKKTEAGVVAKATAAGRTKGAGLAKASTTTGAAKPKAAAAPRTKVVTSGPGQVTVPPKGYATTTASKSAKTAAASTAKKTTTSSKTTSTSSAKATGDYAFLEDKTLSAQEKLILFLAMQKKNTNKELETMLDKAAAQKEAAKKSGGGVTSLFDVAKSVVPALGVADKLLGGKLDDLLKQVSGPMLGAAATALGMPALAPTAMSMGPKLVDAVLNLQVSGAQQASKTSSSSTSGGKGGELDEVELARMQMLQKRVEEWTALISNLMQSFHQSRMNVLQNMR
jgi:hypothetical protein